MHTRAASLGLVAPLLLLACQPAARPAPATPAPCPAPAPASGSAPSPAAVHGTAAAHGTAAHGTAQVPASLTSALPDELTSSAAPVCTRGARVALGDPLTLAVRPGDGFAALDDLTRVVPGADVPRWVEVERVVRPDYALVTLAWPGNDAALIVLARTGHGHCVRAVWGYSFGGLGVALSVADVARVADGTLLIALEAVATFNNPAGDTGDPTEHRRVVLAVAETRAAVLADTQPPGPFQRYGAHHWYFAAPAQGDAEVVATAGEDSMRWRFDAGSWTLVPLASRPSTPEKPRRSR